MSTAAFYSIHNDNMIPALACGQRSVIALPPGRKWITLVDWTTLETAKIDLGTWARLKPVPVQRNARKVKRTMKERLRYVSATETIKQAMASV